jgi:YbbR domain-containing protein
MNKLIDRLFEKDLVIKIVSVLIAILIWFVVLDSDNPFEERTITVPLTSNAEILQAKSLQVVGTPLPASVDIKIKGRRHKINGVTAGDFKVSVDLSEVSESGRNIININAPEYFGEQDIIIVGMNPSSFTVNLERIVGKQYPVEVVYTGSLPTGYEIINQRVEPGFALLEEKESSISKVSKVVVYVNLDEADNNKELVMRATVLDANGDPIKQFDGRIPVIVSYNLAKNVPVIVRTSGNPKNDFYLKEIKYSTPTAKLIGSKSLLEGIKTLEAQSIDISGKDESFIVPLSFNLPKDIILQQAEADGILAEVIIDKLITKEFTLSKSVVTISPDTSVTNMDYKLVEDTIPITVKGKPGDVNSITNSDIRLSVQVNDLEPGQHEIPLTVRTPSSVKVVGEYSVNIIVTAISDQDVSNPTSTNN